MSAWLIAIGAVASLALFILRRFFSQRAELDRLIKKIGAMQDDLRYITDKIAIATRTGNLTSRTKLDQQRLRLNAEIAKLRRRYHYLTGRFPG